MDIPVGIRALPNDVGVIFTPISDHPTTPRTPAALVGAGDHFCLDPPPSETSSLLGTPVRYEGSGGCVDLHRLASAPPALHCSLAKPCQTPPSTPISSNSSVLTVGRVREPRITAMMPHRESMQVDSSCIDLQSTLICMDLGCRGGSGGAPRVTARAQEVGGSSAMML